MSLNAQEAAEAVEVAIFRDQLIDVSKLSAAERAELERMLLEEEGEKNVLAG